MVATKGKSSKQSKGEEISAFTLVHSTDNRMLLLLASSWR